MQPIHTLSLAPDARNWLANSRHPRILHVFDHACNLINKRGEVLSLVTPQIGNGPFNLLLEKDICFSEHLDIESPITILNDQLTLGDLTINLINAKSWSERPDWNLLYARRDDVHHQLMKLPITNYPKCGGFDTCMICQANHVRCQCTPPVNHSGLLNHRYLPIIQSLLSDFTSALVHVDIPTALTITSQLAGLGQGLTPSGDDFIMGAIYAAWIIHPPEIAGPLAREITNIAAPLTTSLSAAWLRSAGRGEAGILWHQFLDTLISAHPVNIQEAMNKILAVGETSGADALAGFIRLFVYWGEYCSKLWEYNQA
jgi:hypothetical protein